MGATTVVKAAREVREDTTNLSPHTLNRTATKYAPVEREEKEEMEVSTMEATSEVTTEVREQRAEDASLSAKSVIRSGSRTEGREERAKEREKEERDTTATMDTAHPRSLITETSKAKKLSNKKTVSWLDTFHHTPSTQALATTDTATTEARDPRLRKRKGKQ